MTNQEKRNLRLGLLFVAPWFVGFLLLNVYPLIGSLYYSFCNFSVLSPAVYIGAGNYKDLFTDEIFWRAISNTFYFAVVSIPLGIVVSLSIAILLNFDLKGKGIFRTIFFLPSLVPMISLAVLWQWILNGQYGLINLALQPVLEAVNGSWGTHFVAPNWLQDAAYSKIGIILTGLWGVGNAVVIYLAGLHDVPRHLYESAELDGANFWHKTRHITIPMISPVIYFNSIMSLIGALQVFAVPYVMTGGEDGPDRSLLFIATYIYRNAFDYWNMGYACALGLILFLIILFLTLLATKLSEKHIYYASK